MKTAIVILNWNGKGFLEKFLPGLIESIAIDETEEDKHDNAHTEIIVADNASSDGSLEMMAEKFPQIKTLSFDRNYGFTGGYNKALRQIEAQYYVLLNSDVEVTDGWLAPLTEWMDTHHLCGACAPKLLSYTDRKRFEYAGAAGGYIDRYGYPFCRGRIMKRTEKDYGQYDEPEDVLWASGACLMVRAELFHRLGGLDGRFFAHQEEIDLCWRIQLEGYRVTVIPESAVYHVGGGTLPNDSPWKLELNYRNNLLMLDNNLAKTYALEYFNENYIEPEGALRDGETPEDEAIAHTAAVTGIRKARKTIRKRMYLDGCSAAVYLLRLRPAYFMSVVKAHRQFRKLSRRPGMEEIEQYLLDKGKIAGVDGIYPKWIVAQAFRHGDDVFRAVRREM